MKCTAIIYELTESHGTAMTLELTVTALPHKLIEYSTYYDFKYHKLQTASHT